MTKAINREVAEELAGGKEGKEEWRPERVETTHAFSKTHANGSEEVQGRR